MPEKALLRGLERRSGGGLRLGIQRRGFAGDIRRAHRGVEIVVNDAERAGICIVNANLLGRELVLDQFVFDSIVGK